MEKPEQKLITEDEVIEISRQCARKIVEKKGNDVLIIDLKDVNSYLDYFVISTGNSQIHCNALAREIQKYFKDVGLKGRSKPQLDTGWIALDYNEIVIHIFTQEMRNYYQLERLWADAGIISF